MISTSLHDENLAADLANGAVAREDLHPHRPKQDPLPRNRRLFQLDVNYRWSDIVLDERFDDEGKAKQQQHSTAYGVEGHDIRAGDRAPDAPDLLVLTKATGTVISETEEGRRTRFFDVYTPDSHTIVLFGAPKVALDILQSLHEFPAGLARAVVVLPQHAQFEGVESVPAFDLVLRDASGHAFKEYGLSPDAIHVVIVRPDGVIGAFVKGTEGVNKYFNTIMA